MDRQVDIGFVKEPPAFHELGSMVVHEDEMIIIGPPQHPLAGRKSVTIQDLAREPFVLNHVCSATEQKVRQLFEMRNLTVRVAAEVWSFENVKEFVRREIGLAIVPRICVKQELEERTLVRIASKVLHFPRRTLMIYRDQAYLSESAKQFIHVMRQESGLPCAPGLPADGIVPSRPAIRACEST
jgi:DNA-binding transcriptional LysR family regulator